MWTPTSDAKYGIAVYNFDGKVKHGLPLEIGETVQILEQNSEWFRGFSTRNKNIKGIFPASYINQKPCTVDNRGPYETVTPIEDPIVKEVAYVLREWSSIWKRFSIERNLEIFDLFKGVMLDLIEWRKELISGKLTLEQKNELKAKITVKVDWGNGRLGLDLVPRDPKTSEQVDPDKISTVELYRVHRTSAQHSKLASVKMGIKEAREAGRTRSCFYVDNRTGSIRPQDDLFRGQTHHIHMVLQNVSCNNVDQTEVYFALYDAKTNKFFSERFLAKLTKNGQAINKDIDFRYTTLFTDLGDDDIERDAYLVAQVYRIGSLTPGESTKKAPKTHYKRPYGCGVISLKEIFGARGGLLQDGEAEQELMMRVDNYSESEFPTSIEHRINKQNTKFQLTSTQINYGLMISLKLLHGDTQKVKKEHPLLFAKGVNITRKLGFSDVIMPGDVRNDLYLILDRGEFEKGGKSAGKNIEVRVMILDGEGNKIPGCISIGSGDTSVTEVNGVIFYHNNTPKWNETFKITIPIEKFSQPKAHFRIEFRHCSTKDKTEKKLFGFSFAKLMADNGTTITDGPHELYLYKCDDVSKLRCVDSYLGLPSSPGELNPDLGTVQGNVFFQRSQKEMVYIETLLCSTKLTQNVDLLGLLKWHEHPEKVEEYLNKLLCLEGEEIVKYLQDILDALFTMLTAENQVLPDPQLVFHALIFIFTLLEGRKFAQFQPVLEAYLTDHFFDPRVYIQLLTSLKNKVEIVPTAERQDILQNTFRVIEYVVKFIVQSRLLCARHMPSQSQDDFRLGLDEVMNAMYKVLSLNVEVITKTQCELLRNIPKLYPHLLKLLTGEELSFKVSTLIGKIPKDHLPDIGQVKLECIKETVNSELFRQKESRRALLPMCMSQLKRYMINKQEMKLCTSILGDILDTLYKQQESCNLDEEIHMLVSAMVDVVVQAVFTVDKTHHVTGLLVACLIDMLRLMNDNHYKAVLDGYKDRKPLKDFLLRVLTVFKELVRQDVFPRDWMVMRMVTNNVILIATQYFSQSLNKHFLRTGEFDCQLWTSYFNLAVYFLTQPSLQLEQFTEAKREKIIEKYGDMRVRTGFEILAMWQNLGDHKINFIPGMVGPFLEVTLVPESELRKATLPIFFDMMECEQRERGNFKQVESELIDKLDILISDNKGDDEYRQLFNTILMGKVHSDPQWQENGTAFIQSVTSLLERLLDYRNVMEGDENRDKRMTCTVNLLNFYKNEINRQEMYIRYIYKLCDLHLAAENFVEAGFTLLLHADLLNWDDTVLHADLKYPAQPEWERKETIYLEVIQYMDKGKCWENGLPLCKELASLYEQKFKYAKLRDNLQTQARFLNNILNEMRLEPEYFRVGFYGQSFPLFLRNKQFVYRGLEFEKLASFQQRLQMEFPSATLLSSNNPPSDNIRQGDSQCIQICNVKPVVDVDSRFQNQEVSSKIKSFYMSNEVENFQFDRPFHRGEKKDKNEFKTLCLERTSLKIASKLPGILRWFEVIDSETVQLSPVEAAIISIEHVHRQIQDLVTQYNLEPNKNLSPLTMRLNGVLDAAVNGGISLYEEAFFTEEFAASYPEHLNYVSHLKHLLQEQVKLLSEALLVHGRLASIEVKPLHNRMIECLGKMKRNLHNSGSPKVSSRMSTFSTGSFSSSGSKNSWLDTLGSGSSVSPSLTPTPPGSNRSSGIYSENPSENTDSEIYAKPSEIQDYHSSTSPRVKRNKNPKGPRISSDPTIGAKVDNLAKEVNIGASSTSLDSALSSQKRAQQTGQVCMRKENSLPMFMQQTSSPDDTPPKLPPRKPVSSAPAVLEKTPPVPTSSGGPEDTPPELPARTGVRHSNVSFKTPSSGQQLYSCLPPQRVQEEAARTASPPHLATRPVRSGASFYELSNHVRKTSTDNGPAPPIPPKTRSTRQAAGKYVVVSPAGPPSPASVAASETQSNSTATPPAVPSRNPSFSSQSPSAVKVRKQSSSDAEPAVLARLTKSPSADMAPSDDREVNNSVPQEAGQSSPEKLTSTFSTETEKG